MAVVTAPCGFAVAPYFASIASATVSPRVLLLCGSLQQRSSNGAALAIVRRRLVDGGADVDEFELLAAVEPFNIEHDDAPPPVALEWRARTSAADAAVLAGPEYAGALAGTMKNALDWLVGAAGLYEKPVALISSGTTGGTLALADLTRTLTWQGTKIIGQLGIAAPRTKTDDDGAFTDEPTIAAIEQLVDDLLAATASGRHE